MHKQVLYLARHMNPARYEPIVCVSRGVGGLKEEYEGAGVSLIDLKWRRRFDLRTLLRLVNVLQRVEPNVVFITEPQQLFYYRMARIFWRSKVVQFGSFRAMTFWHGHKGGWRKVLDNIFASWLYRTSHVVTANAEALRHRYGRLVTETPEKPIRVVYNGFDFKFPPLLPREETRKAFGLDHNDIMIVMVARLDPWKDFDTLFAAAAVVKEQRRDIKFILVGDGVLRHALQDRIVQMGIGENVKLAGERRNVYDFINAADISLLSSFGEGLSNTLIESMALGKPVIATDVGGNRELIGEDGCCGIVIPANSPERMAHSILLLAGDKGRRRTMGENAFRRIGRLTGIERYVDTYQELIDEAMRKSGDITT